MTYKLHFSSIKSVYKKIERTLSSLKFAVVIISFFAIALIFGTFMESYHGANFAGRLVYKSWWFMCLQGLMFLSILMATLVRLPPKKRLYGFYTIHAGLIILFIGSFITFTTGVDGSLELYPGKPNNKVVIDEDHFQIRMSSSNKLFDFKLPYSAGPQEVYGQLREEKFKLNLLQYLPSAKYETEWKKPSNPQLNSASGRYQVFNANVSQEITLSLNPNSDFQSMERLGPLSVHLMPALLHDCYLIKSKSGYILWDLDSNKCFSAEDKRAKIQKTEKNASFFVIKRDGKELKFFPDFSPFPINEDLTKDESSPLRVISRGLFEDKPHLFIFGEKIIFYKKRGGWQSADLQAGPATLPWMGFQLRLLDFRTDEYPTKQPVYIKPIQDGGEIVDGKMSAVQVEVAGGKYWVTTEAPVALTNGNEKIEMIINKKVLKLPYQITLDKFNMDKNPGTNTPASFESFVSLLDGRKTTGATKHHVFMNNPLKYDGFTFYQASYFQVGPEEFGSALSVNFDPGRWIKYLGSLLIVLGSTWHFLLQRRRRRIHIDGDQMGESNA